MNGQTTFVGWLMSHDQNWRQMPIGLASQSSFQIICKDSYDRLGGGVWSKSPR